MLVRRATMVGISMLGEAISRRDFIKHAGGVAAAWPLSARAEQPKRIRGIGVLHPFADGDLELRSWVNALKEALATLGWNDGLNVRLHVRGGGGDLDQMRNFARELIDLHADVLVAITTRSVNAVLAETHTIRSYSPWSLIQLANDWLRPWLGRAKTSLDSHRMSNRRGANGCRSSRR